MKAAGVILVAMAVLVTAISVPAAGVLESESSADERKSSVDEGDRGEMRKELADLRQKLERNTVAEEELRASLRESRIENRALQARLESRLARIHTDTVDETLDWGSGLFFSTNLHAPNLYELELGYKFRFANRNLPLRRAYVGNRRGMDIGVAFGVMQYHDEPVHDPDVSGLYESSAVGPYVKLVYGSPVLLNFISTTAHLKLMYLSKLDVAGEGFADNDWGMGMGANLNFWLYQNMSINFGFTHEGSFKGFSNENGEGDRHLLSWKIRPTGGITLFF